MQLLTNADDLPRSAHGWVLRALRRYDGPAVPGNQDPQTNQIVHSHPFSLTSRNSAIDFTEKVLAGMAAYDRRKRLTLGEVIDHNNKASIVVALTSQLPKRILTSIHQPVPGAHLNTVDPIPLAALPPFGVYYCHTTTFFFFLHCRTSARHCRSTAGWEWKWDQNSLGSEQENTTKSQTNTTNQTPKTKTQARSLSCLGKCKLGETSETCAPLSAPQKFSSTSMYFSICPVLNVSHVNICHHVLRRIPDIRLQALSLDLIRAFACLPLFRTILQKEIDFRLCSTFFVVKCLQ